jgi:hypothetical protein
MQTHRYLVRGTVHATVEAKSAEEAKRLLEEALNKDRQIWVSNGTRVGAMSVRATSAKKD